MVIEKQQDCQELLDWFDDSEDSFNQGTKAPHKWVLQAHAELMLQQRRIEELEAALDSIGAGGVSALKPPFKTNPEPEPELVLNTTPIVELVGIDEYGPLLKWRRHWVELEIGTKLYMPKESNPSSYTLNLNGEPKPKPKPQDLELPLLCDTCGADCNNNPWHYSTEASRHNHACDDCWPLINSRLNGLDK